MLISEAQPRRAKLPSELQAMELPPTQPMADLQPAVDDFPNTAEKAIRDLPDPDSLKGRQLALKVIARLAGTKTFFREEPPTKVHQSPIDWKLWPETVDLSREWTNLTDKRHALNLRMEKGWANDDESLAPQYNWSVVKLDVPFFIPPLPTKARPSGQRNEASQNQAEKEPADLNTGLNFGLNVEPTNQPALIHSKMPLNRRQALRQLAGVKPLAATEHDHGRQTENSTGSGGENEIQTTCQAQTQEVEPAKSLEIYDIGAADWGCPPAVLNSYYRHLPSGVNRESNHSDSPSDPNETSRKPESANHQAIVLDLTRVDIIASLAERHARSNGRLPHWTALVKTIRADATHRSLLQDEDFVGLVKKYGAGSEDFVAWIKDKKNRPNFYNFVYQSPSVLTYLQTHQAADLLDLPIKVAD